VARRSHNRHLSELPDDVEFLRAVLWGETEGRRGYEMGATAQSVAWRLEVGPARRLGNGAVKGTWSGIMAPALRVAPRLRALTKRGLLREHWGDRRIEWALTVEGHRMLEELDSA